MSRALAASRSALVLNFLANSLPWAAMPLASCSAERSCSVTSMPEATHQPAMSAPMVPAPMMCARTGRHFDVLRRLRLQGFRQLEHAAQVARLLGDHERREGPRLRGLQRVVVAAVVLEEIDQTERRGIVILARLLGRLVAHLLGEQTARRPHRQQRLGEPGGLRLALLQHGLARRPAQRALARRPARR